MKISISTWKIATTGVVLLMTMFAVCAQKESKSDILAIVGDRVITTDEFIRRAEYTIRPPYCKQNSNIDKQIILNSIIAEKLYAFEAGDNNPLSRNMTFQAYIQGRKEQVMRQILFDKIVKKKIKPDTSELNKRYLQAGSSRTGSSSSSTRASAASPGGIARRWASSRRSCTSPSC